MTDVRPMSEATRGVAEGGRDASPSAREVPAFGWAWPMLAVGGVRDEAGGLPDVWVTEEYGFDDDARHVWHFSGSAGQSDPSADGAATPDTDARDAIDPVGELADAALRIGGQYYDEGMSRDPREEHENRVRCFEAAELLYLHASRLGNSFADLCLGYVYSYDRCEGRYWGTWNLGPDERFDRERHAYERYRTAAEHGIAEACYKLGDLLRDGVGCEADPYQAFGWFKRGYELGLRYPEVVWGSAALRVAECLEEGIGCEQSFSEALAWYERATTGLGIAVRAGDGWYRKSLRCAERGLKRVRQELSGTW